MKKCFYISVILTIAAVVLLLTGMVSFGSGIGAAIAQGNRHYREGDLQKALDSYAGGLAGAPQDAVLNYNSAQACYSLKDYGQAMGYYDKAGIKKADKYLNMGNSCLRQADASGDENQKQQLYQQALQAYMKGILEFPQEISLKYNYEYVKEKLQQQQQNDGNNQENNQDQQNNENQQNDENSDGQQGKNQDSQDGNHDNKENNQDQSDSQDSQQGGKEDNEKENGQSGGQNNEEDKQQDGSENQQGSQVESQPGENSDGSTSDSPQNASEIEQVLRALEKQEEDSLKNNQAIRGDDKEDKYDW